MKILIILSIISTFFYLIKQNKKIRIKETFITHYLLFLSLLISKIRSGYTLITAIFETVYYLPDGKFKEEVLLLINRIKQGGNIKDGMNNFALENSDLVHSFKSSVVITSENGSSVTPCLQRIYKVTKDKQQFRMRIKTALSAQRLSAVGVIFSLGIVLMSQFLNSKDNILEILVSDSIRPFFIAAVVLNISGISWLIKLCKAS